MASGYKVSPFRKQDELNEGLLKTEDGRYVEISLSSALIDDSWEKLADFDEQDKLEEGLIKIDRSYEDYYIPINKLEEVKEEEFEEGCFIATAVYGTIQAPQVKILRDYRDKVLKKNSFGRLLTSIYYSGVGKKGAKFIREKMPSSIPPIRKGLDFLIEMHSKRK